MTLDLAQYFANIIHREGKISHFNCKIFGGETSKLRGKYKSLILKEYGDKYLLDADYILIFKDGDAADSEAPKQLFKLVKRALGTNANNLAQSDFKYVELESESSDVETTADEENGESETVENTVVE